MDDIQALGDTATSRQSIEQRPRLRWAPARARRMSVRMGAQNVCEHGRAARLSGVLR